MANLLLPLLTIAAERARVNFIQKTRQTLAVQEQFLLRLLHTYRDTELGRKYGIATIKTIDQFRSQVPVLPYTSYEPYSQRVAQGESNILTPDRVVYINTTSGSTRAQKYIPVTQRFQRSLGWANLTSIGFLIEGLRSRQLQFGSLLAMNAVLPPKLTSGGIEYGPAGPGVLRMGKVLYEQLFANPYDTLKPEDSITRHYICLLFALSQSEMRGLGANFPMLVLRLCNYLEKYAEDLLQDLEHGTIASWLKLEPELRVILERRWQANPVRANQLRGALKSEGRLTPRLAWSNLSFVATAQGGTSDFYFERFPAYFGDTPIAGMVYSSAEGTCGIYPDLNTNGCVLAIETGFFEFIPEDQWEAEHPKTLLATEVKAGNLYRILMTNYSGFYRYDIGDVVEVLGFYQTAPLIVFRYRNGGILSSTTEKTTESHATQTMKVLQQEFNLPLEDFCITLSENEFPAHYLVNIELVSGYTLSDPQSFLVSFDRLLKEINTYYGFRRKDQIPPPRLRILSAGSFAIIRQRQLTRGIPDFQLKFPHISEDRNFLAGLVVEQEIKLPEEGVGSKE